MEAARPALFSLQVGVDEASVRAPGVHASPAAGADLLLAFQLLQFDIVVLDGAAFVLRDDGSLALADAADGADAVGQSCLFESDAQRLADAVRGDESAALALLVLRRVASQAALVGCACVALPLPHLAFDGARPRVSEWVSVESAWPLVDQHGDTVGSVRGTVTLSCLGRALAPHVAAQRFGGGLHVLTSGSSKAAESPRSTTSSAAVASVRLASDEEDGDRKEEGEPAMPTPVRSPVQAVSSRMPEQLRDAAVQCDTDEDGAQENEESQRRREPTPLLIRSGARTRNGSPQRRQLHVVGRSENAPMRRHGVRVRGDETRPLQRQVRERGGPFLASELPPPLYFHKPKR